MKAYTTLQSGEKTNLNPIVLAQNSIQKENKKDVSGRIIGNTEIIRWDHGMSEMVLDMKEMVLDMSEMLKDMNEMVQGMNERVQGMKERVQDMKEISLVTIGMR